MYSILNHQPLNTKPLTPLNNLPIQQGQNTLINHLQYHKTPKVSIKQLYKYQLDQFMEEKQKQKKSEKQKLQKQKEDYRQKVRIGQQNQKMKDLAYKNVTIEQLKYYKMLMQSHEHNSESYVSPYELRDRLKQSHIQNSLQQQSQRFRNYEYEKRIRQQQKKNIYKQELEQQILQRKRLEGEKKTYLQEESDYYRQYHKNPQEIELHQRERKKGEMETYKHDLDQIIHDKHSQSKKASNLDLGLKLRISDDLHNPLVNPLPYNIQNPYILKEMQKLSASTIKNQPQFSAPEGHQKIKNQSSYFAKRGNNVLK